MSIGRGTNQTNQIGFDFLNIVSLSTWTFVTIVDGSLPPSDTLLPGYISIYAGQ